MSKFLIEGGKRLSGGIDIQGSKNSALPILSACILTKKPVVIHNCPELSDTFAAIKILEALGCTVKREFDTVTAARIAFSVAPTDGKPKTICPPRSLLSILHFILPSSFSTVAPSALSAFM